MVLFFVLLGVGCTPQCERNQFEPAKPLMTPTPEFKMNELETGSGAEIQTGDQLKLHYRCWLYDPDVPEDRGGLIMDTRSQGQPLQIVWGQADLIEGWLEGLKGARQGSKRVLFIPASMAYGENGAGSQIPPGAHLVYEIEVVEVASKGSSDSTKAVK